MNKEYLFTEDARKHKKSIVLLAVLFYACFAVFSGLLIYEIISQKYSLGLLRGILIIVFSLFLAIFFTWAVCSKYLKYYMFISNEEIVFFQNKKEHKYNVSEFIRFEKIKAKSNYAVYKLYFGESSHTVTSFKPSEFENALNSIKYKLD